MIPTKLYCRMTDLAEDSACHPDDWKKEKTLIDFQDSIDWPFSASQDQIEGWNAKNWEIS